MEYQKQLQRIKNGSGFIAALDQSGGSTPKALENYGVMGDAYGNDEAMFDQVHEMRARIMTCDCFDNERVLGAILFEDTMERAVNGKPTANYLWEDKQIVPFLKVDKGLAERMNGVQVMRPMPNLDRSETTIRCGIPISSRSANFTPGRSLRSSSNTLIPRAFSSSYNAIAVCMTVSSFDFIGTIATSNGARESLTFGVFGHMMPLSSLFCSIAAAMIRLTPIP